jgi:hypothetical protein
MRTSGLRRDSSLSIENGGSYHFPATAVRVPESDLPAAESFNNDIAVVGARFEVIGDLFNKPATALIEAQRNPSTAALERWIFDSVSPAPDY